MTRRSLKDVKALLLGWAKKSPEIFDQPNNELLIRHYIYNFCALVPNIVSDSRITEWPIETILRGARLLVSTGEIKMSDENKQHRHVEDKKTVETIKEIVKPINYSEAFDFTKDGRAIPKQ